ncbi:MAG TPA: hypothetical protein VMW65_16240 [Chloroflexota bacterium]|nr:hypothetical protein [Chloroflexota bacterium]
MTADPHSYFFEVVEAFASPGCGICALVTRARTRFLDSLAYESINDIALREKLRQSLGLCNRHAWFFLNDVREPLGTAIIYRDILRTLYRATARANSVQKIVPAAPCLACAIERVSTDDALFTIVESLDRIELIDALSTSSGLCGPHLVRACQLAPPRRGRQLLEIVQVSWSRRDDQPGLLATLATGAPGTFGSDRSRLNHTLAEKAVEPDASNDPYACRACKYVQNRLACQETSGKPNQPPGLCNVHARFSTGDRSVALCRQTRKAWLGQAQALVERSEGGALLEKAWHFWRTRPPPTPAPAPCTCLVCVHQAVLEAECINTAGTPLCLPHLRQTWSLGNRAALADIRPTWLTLSELLGEYIRKEDYRFRHEPRGAERDSPRWATALVAGSPGIA